MKLKHPKLPMELTASTGAVWLHINGKHADTYGCEALPVARAVQNPDQIAQIKKLGKNPDDYRILHQACLSPEPFAWVVSELPALIAHAAALRDEQRAKQNAQASARAAAEAPLLAKMHAEAEAIRAAMPANCVALTVAELPGGDGWRFCKFTAPGGIELHLVHDQVTHHTVHAIHPGAFSAFATIDVAWAPRAIVEAATHRAAVKSAEDADRAQQHLAALTRSVPAEAIQAYRACNGDPDTLPDGIDHPDYWLVKQWAPAIEHQGLELGSTMKRRAAEARGECPTDYLGA